MEDGLWVIEWNEGSQDDIGMGNLWEMADPEKSASLAAYDRNLDEEEIWKSVLRDNGIELLPDYEVEDVVISRHKVEIHLENGNTLTIDRSAYHFFENLSPDYPLMIARNVSDGVDYAIWGDKVHMVPLSAFKLHTEGS